MEVVNNPHDMEEGPVLSLGQFFLLLIGMSAGALAAIWILPAWLPGLSTSVSGQAPKAFWFLSRSSAITAYMLLWVSMVLGVLMTNRLARIWPGGPVAYDLHQYASLLGVGFALFHMLILLGDAFANYSLAQLLIPFAADVYRPFWVGIGQVAFYLFLLVAFSFYLRKQIGQRLWRVIHFLSFLVYCGVLAHGVFAGSDSALGGMRVLYWATGGGLLFLFVYRLLGSLFPEPRIARNG